MDDFSLYQWLILGLLSFIALAIAGGVTGTRHDLQASADRIVEALQGIRQEVEDTTSRLKLLQNDAWDIRMRFKKHYPAPGDKESLF